MISKEDKRWKKRNFEKGCLKYLEGIKEFYEKHIDEVTQKIEIYFNFIGEYIPPTMAEKEPRTGKQAVKLFLVEKS